jgi:hypothetical protein
VLVGYSGNGMAPHQWFGSVVPVLNWLQQGQRHQPQLATYVHGALTQPPMSRQTSVPPMQVHRGRVSARLQIMPPEQSLATSQVPVGGNPVAAACHTHVFVKVREERDGAMTLTQCKVAKLQLTTPAKGHPHTILYNICRS